MKYSVSDDIKMCDIEFDLAKGCYATICLRDIMEDKVLMEDNENSESENE